MRERLGFYEHAAVFQFGDNSVIRLPDALAPDHWDLRIELTVAVHGLQKRQTMVLHGREVVGAERRRHVHHTATVFRRHEGLGNHDLVMAFVRISHPV